MSQMKIFLNLLVSLKKKIKNKTVLDGELAVLCNLKSAICRIEFQSAGWDEFDVFVKAVLILSALRNDYFFNPARSGKKQR